ncbi:TonB-dependent receptor [Dysgonomonas macrotermitis]|uniref:Iron complex outermembrane recepter protein n=1 Tax=Dysgonomonas macrotermitis TaxID=1346286 RepID=A0A1M4X1K4_9BACT|nr:TonB-dependent receptor [Dysgonomonas macrotermitis]SHE87325.1 iron complex outermembrane recepter protein [Dysgonomonas macrotermitis]
MKRIFKGLFLLSVLLFLSLGTFAQPVLPDISIRDTIGIDEVVVTGTRTSVTSNNLPMSVSVVTETQLENRQDQSVLPILVERVPSLFITSRSVMGYGASTGAAGAMSMRGVGGTGSQLLMLIDGHPQFMGIFSHPLNDTYQTLMAERVEVVRGPASVLYGSNAMGGVINILTKKQQDEGVRTQARLMYGSYNTLSAEATNMARYGKFNSVLSLGYNRSDGHRDNMDFEQYSGYAKVGYDLTPNWKSFVDLDLSKSYSSNPGTVDVPMFDNDMDILRGVTSFSLTNNYDRTSGAVKLFYNFGDHYINDGYREGGTPRESRFNSTDWMFGLMMFQNYSLWQGNQTTIGFDYQRYGGHAWTSYVNDNPDSKIAREYMSDYAGYVNFQQMLWDKLMVNAGIRFDHHTVAGNEWIPQIGLSYFAAPNTTIKGIVSKGYRNPTMRELYMWGPKNPDLKPEDLMNYEVSLNQHLLNRRLALELNLYYIKGNNSIVAAPAENSAGWQYMNTGELENYGLEVSANYYITPRLNINANYSYLHMEHEIAAAPKHKIFAGVDYSMKKWLFSTGLQYVNDLVTEAPDLVAGTSGEKDSFLLWNVRVSYKVAKWCDLFARGENLLDQNYQMYTGYPMPGATVFGGVSVKF